MVICRNDRVGTWSQSKIDTNSPWHILKRIVDVARFRMFMEWYPGDIFHPNFAQTGETLPYRVIEDPDVQLVFRPVDTQRVRK